MAIIYDLLQWTWGLSQTIVGFIYFLTNIKQEHYYYHGSVVTIWKSKSSLSLGVFVFVSDNPFCYYDSIRETYSEDEFSNMLLVHEYGHTIQSLFFGPLYLLLVGVPSIMWSFLPVYVRKRDKEQISYFSAYPERWANSLGDVTYNYIWRSALNLKCAWLPINNPIGSCQKQGRCAVD